MTSVFRLADAVGHFGVPWGTLRPVCTPSSVDARQFAILDGTLAVGQGHDFHFHPAQEEMIYVVDGLVEQWIEGERQVLRPGEAAFIAPGVVHASFNAGPTDARLIAILGPSVGPDGVEMIDKASEEPWCSLRGR